MDFKRNKKTAVLSENQNGDHEIIIRFPENDYDALYNVRSIPERKYHKEERKWSAPVSVNNIVLLGSFGFAIDDKLASYLQMARSKESEIIREGIVLAPQVAGHNLKNKLGLIKFGNHDINTTKIYT